MSLGLFVLFLDQLSGFPIMWDELLKIYEYNNSCIVKPITIKRTMSNQISKAKIEVAMMRVDMYLVLH